MFKKLAYCLIVALIGQDNFTAKVIGVTDGDTIVVFTENNEQIKIRLEGIDCPESHQDYGEKAKQATVDLCFGKLVKVQKTGQDQYGRMLAYVYVGDICINKQLLRLGLAWHYKQYNKEKDLSEIESNARAAKVGVWSNPRSIAPWDWRHKK
jgi:micrococcal nuclease